MQSGRLNLANAKIYYTVRMTCKPVLICLKAGTPLVLDTSGVFNLTGTTAVPFFPPSPAHNTTSQQFLNDFHLQYSSLRLPNSRFRGKERDCSQSMMVISDTPVGICSYASMDIYRSKTSSVPIINTQARFRMTFAIVLINVLKKCQKQV